MIFIGYGSIGMDLGQLLLLISVVAFILEALFVILGEYIEKWEIYSDLSLIIGSSALMISFFYFSFAIISADYAFTYVSNNLNNNMDFILRLSVIWSGQEGSYFFWAFSAVIIYLIFRRLFQSVIHEAIIWRSFVLMAIQVTVLIVLTIMSDPFKLNTETMTDGLGLNPLLLTYWNVIHPPTILLGYALCLVPMVIGIARISLLEEGKIPSFDEKEKLDKFFEFMVSLAWLVLSSGIIIGGYWAYITLGWGGFWAWDPVETASLIPWLFLTLYYHGRSFHNKSQYLGNYVISMTYIGALFATYLTRSAIVSSVHTFEPEGSLEKILAPLIPENSFLMNIILRFLPDEQTLLLFVFIVGIFLVPHILGIKNKELLRIRISVQKADFKKAKLHNTTLKISYIAFFIGTYVMILGLITPVVYDIIGYILTVPFLYEFYSFLQEGSNNILPLVSQPDGFLESRSIGPIFYNTMLTLFGGIMLLAQFFCIYYPRLSIKRKFGLMIGGVTAGIVFSVSGILYRDGTLTSILGTGNPILSFFSNFWTTS
ncbi:MAG: cytochrome c biogenesis protein CcsA, partial [Candidatus Heimdallarchaeota archaeon]